MHKNLFKSPSDIFASHGFTIHSAPRKPLACEDATAMTFVFIPGLAK